MTDPITLTELPDRGPERAEPNLEALAALIVLSGQLSRPLTDEDREGIATLAREGVHDDVGRASTVLKLNGGLAWDAANDRFKYWDGRAWVEDGRGHEEVRRRIDAAVEIIVDCVEEDVEETLDGLPPTPPRGLTDPTTLAAYALRGNARKLRDARARDAVQKQLRHTTQVDEPKYDVEPNELNAPNGLADLTTDEPPRPHDRSMRVTRLAGAPFDPTATSPTWDALIARFVPDPATRASLQEALGLCVLGSAATRTALIFQGPPGTGKSTIAEIVSTALGTYATRIDHRGLGQGAEHGGLNNDHFAKVAGARMAVIDELPPRYRPDLAKLKRLTGSTTVSVMQKFKPEREVRATCTLLFITNHDLRIDPDEQAAWGRLLTFPFEEQVPEEEQDRQAIERLTKDGAVLAAALAWMVAGAKRVLARQGRVDVAPAILARREQLRRQANPLDELVEEGLITLEEGAYAASADLDEVLNAYAREHRGWWRPRARALKAALEALGCEGTRVARTNLRGAGSRRGWQGLRVEPEALGLQAAMPSPADGEAL
jgi:P4 family phage/plasmid primase-like protien